MDASVPIESSRVARRLKLSPAQVDAVVKLLGEGNSSSYVARYCKDATGGLDESQVRAIRHEATRAQQLAHRKESVLRAAQAQGRLTDELSAKVEAARDLEQVEDLFMPFRATKDPLATTARERGLAPLAAEIVDGTVSGDGLEARAADFVDPDRKLTSVADVLLGAGHIVAEDLSDDATLRGALRRCYREKAMLVSRTTATEAAKPAAVAAPPPPADAPAAEVPAEKEEPAEEAKPSAQTTCEQTIAAEPPPCEAPAANATSEAKAEATTPPAATDEQAAAKAPTPAAPAKASKSKKKQAARQNKQFAEYADFRAPLGRLKPHQVLTINRGERSGQLTVTVEIDPSVLERAAAQAIPAAAQAIPAAAQAPPAGPETSPEAAETVAPHPHADFLRGCLSDAIERLLMPGLAEELRRELTQKAEEHAIDVFCCNLRNLLLQRPVGRKRILAIAPNFKSGSKMAALGADGELLAQGVLHIVGNKERLAESRAKLVELVRQHKLEAIAIGTGSASREVEQVVGELLTGDLAAEADAGRLAYIVVSSAGAEDYGASQVGREEFPDVEAAVRAAIFIGRRLLDPLAELVKVDPASLASPGLQHDLAGKDIRATLVEVVESCVNHVGVDLNRANAAQLRYVSGLNPLLARRLFEHRQQHGPFASRAALKDVSGGLGDDSFEQAAGFLRIEGGENPFDASWIHPQHYELAEKIRAELGSASDGDGDAAAPQPDVPALAAKFAVGERLVRDIIVELKRPGRDPRVDLPEPIFRSRPLKLEDLAIGQELPATVLNVVDFGAFVDIGLNDSALVHVSQMAAGYISDPQKLVAVGDSVRVWVKAIDTERGRVTLTMVQPGVERRPREGGPRRRRRGKEGGPAHAKKKPRTGQGKGAARGARKGGRHAAGPRRERKPKPLVPITDAMLKGDEPMRTFGDLKQFMDQQDSEDGEESAS
ncbi:MAG: S1 RNA-binding domain-containing protein [Planctomycetota bacterium]|nr:MAG: S1 RNA-binding domain-containing protein [Planctomycetota bacterium]REK49446.1 MAG: S1 RNA-binding domain-containing protein [Planctomycetota bacterium]